MARFAPIRSASGGAILALLSTSGAAAGAPSNVTPSPISGTSIGLTWAAGAPVATTHQVESESPAGAGNWAAASGSVSGLAFTGTGCTPATSYQFRVRGVNGVGVSAWVLSGEAWTDNTVSGGSEIPSVPTSAPVITLQPQSQSAVDGGNFTFTCEATGVPTPTAQVQISSDGGVTWADIPGATSGTYTRPASFVDSGKRIRFVWTNGVGAPAASASAILTVTAVTSPPVVTLQPVSQAVIEGQAASFVAAFSGAPTPTLQWRRNGVDIVGATSGTLSFTPVLGDDGSLYSCRAVNVAGSVITSDAILAVAPLVAPSFTTQPQPAIGAPGSTVQFNAAVVGSPPITYQWQKNGVGIPGATAIPLVYTVLTGDEGAEFTLIATNAGGFVESDPAPLTLTTSLPTTLHLARQYKVNPDAHLDAYSIQRGYALNWEKDPQALLDYSIDWSAWLAEGDSIASLTVLQSAGIVVPAQGIRGAVTAVMVGGGDDGTDEEVTLRILTSQGRTDDRTIKLLIRNR